MKTMEKLREQFDKEETQWKKKYNVLIDKHSKANGQISLKTEQ